ncbi:MAG: hypothetical protein RQ751_00905 [Longimicrobiales bacterium]|nr:hypothetical protein [Longimicrobiales bacterium]
MTFVSTGGDSLFMVPWILEATTLPGGVRRSARGWLARGDTWDPFLRATWEAPPSREPWRILPHGPLRVLVGEGDRLDRIFFDGGSRRLEVALEAPLVGWTGSRGGSFTLLEGGLILGDRRVPGHVLDVSQGIRTSEGSLGDWLFLASGDSLMVVVQAPLHRPDDGGYQGWARDGFQELQWPEVRVSWEDQRAFEPARRDVPGTLVLEAPAGTLSGRLRVVALHLEVREGSGPVLPVDGILAVQGTLEVRGRSLPVRGVLRHRQP